MADIYPQSPKDSEKFLSERQLNAENERLKRRIRELEEMVRTLQDKLDEVWG